jgi:hypothetical protein
MFYDRGYPPYCPHRLRQERVKVCYDLLALIPRDAHEDMSPAAWGAWALTPAPVGWCGKNLELLAYCPLSIPSRARAARAFSASLYRTAFPWPVVVTTPVFFMPPSTSPIGRAALA